MSDPEEQGVRDGFTLLLVGLLAVGAPLLLIFFRPVLVRYELVEELAKLALVGYLARELGGRVRLWQPIVLGAMFGMTETVLYVMNAMEVGAYEGLLWRATVTVPMHAVTPLVMLTMGLRWGRGGWLVGYLGAVLVHVTFNWLVGGL